MSAAALCRRCGREIDADRVAGAAVFEGMHWLCFHLEFEHDTDPDMPCGDYASCPWWTIAYLKERLSALGVDPETVLAEAVLRKTGRD